MKILSMFVFAACCILAIISHDCCAQEFEQTVVSNTPIESVSYLPDPMTLSKRDTITSQRDKHVLISGGGGRYFGSGSGYFAIVGLEYPIDSARKWNIEVNWFYYFNTFSSSNQSSGLLCFRRYLKPMESLVRPSIHFGFGIEPSLDLGLGLDCTIIERSLYAQICVRKLISLYVGRRGEPTTPYMIGLSTRVML